MEAEWDSLLEWLEGRLRLGDVPRVVDVVRYAKQNKMPLSRKSIVGKLALHPAYLFSMEQKR